MNGFGASAYARVDVDSGVASADPHRLVLMLFDGALEAIKLAEGHIAAGRVSEKGKALGKAVRIVEEGLKASLDKNAGGPLARQLAALYDYASLRLLQANLKNDHAALREVARLLADLRGAWSQIGSGAQAAAPKAVQPPVAAPPTLDTAARFVTGSDAPSRRVVVTA